MNQAPLLEVRGLAVAARSKRGDLEIVQGVDLVAAPGEAIGVVGESGSGKSLTMLAIMRLLAPPARHQPGQRPVRRQRAHDPARATDAQPCAATDWRWSTRTR